jgi:hypothetical protein
MVRCSLAGTRSATPPSALDAGAAGAQPLGEGPLRDQLELDPAGEVLVVELLEDRERAGDPAQPALVQQPADPGEVVAHVVDEHVQVAAIQCAQRVQQGVRPAGAAEAAHRDGGARRDGVDHRQHVVAELVDHWALSPARGHRPPEALLARDAVVASRRSEYQQRRSAGRTALSASRKARWDRSGRPRPVAQESSAEGKTCGPRHRRGRRVRATTRTGTWAR